MSEHAHDPPRSIEVPAGEFTGGERAFRIALIAAAVGVAIVVVGLVVNHRQAMFSYLTAWAYVTAIALGTLIFLMISYAMNTTWPVVLRRIIENAAGTVVVLALLFIPIALRLADLYIWVTPEKISPGVEGEHLVHVLHHKAGYLNVPGVLIRSVFYFGVWIAIALLLRRWSLASDRTTDEVERADLLRKARIVSAAGLPVLGLTLTFAAFDWLMSLSPGWFSTAFGVYYFAGGFLGAFALLIIALHLATRPGGALAGLASGSHFHSLGRMMFAVTVFWAYIAYFQAFLIWSANKPEEVVWYISRVDRGWLPIVVILAIGHFALPFLLLLSRRLKYRTGRLAAIAVWQLAMGYVDVHWLVIPTLHEGGFPLEWLWLDLGALAAVGGIAVAFGIWRARGHAIVPHRDPRLGRSITYRSW